MEKQVVWTAVLRNDFWEIVAYLSECWLEQVLKHFSSSLNLKVKLLQKHPNIGFKSAEHSRFRTTLVTKHYLLIYSVTKNHVVIHHLKHAAMR